MLAELDLSAVAEVQQVGMWWVVGIGWMVGIEGKVGIGGMVGLEMWGQSKATEKVAETRTVEVVLVVGVVVAV